MANPVRAAEPAPSGADTSPLTTDWLLQRSNLELTALNGWSTQFLDIQTNELRTPADFIIANAIILTLGMSFTDNPAALEEYVDTLVKAGAVAIGFGTGYAFDTVPQPLLAAADRHRIPVFEVSPHIPFISVIHAVHQEHARRAAQGEQWQQRVQQQLNKDAVTGDVHRLLASAASSLQAAIAIADNDARVLVNVPFGGVDAGELLVADIEAGHHHSRAGRTGELVQLTQRLSEQGDRVNLMMVVRRSSFHTRERSVLQHCGGLADILLQRPSFLRAARSEMNSLALALLLGIDQEESSVAHAMHHAVDSQGRVRAVVVRADDPAALTAARNTLDKRLIAHSRALFSLQLEPDMQLFLFRGSRDDHDIVDHFGAEARDIAIAMGAAIRWNELTREHVAELSRRARAIATGEHVGPFNVKASWLHQPEVLRALHARGAETFDVLTAADERDGTEYARTLELYLRLGGHIGDTAAALGAHRHTVRSRLAHISEVCDVDLSDAVIRAELLFVAIARE
ncbi:Purine catabolism regulatory protein-like family protein [Corynebacterium ciconiae DSM 44920]|uniref:PucR family transcriptional regulator n=1 Tax=Corynebacterium ciconiae TaxID=227319 RepID=UPI00036E90BE|nr:PucR family transcriptional regulator [Corynebacterium ciconiae]WKD60350.1 Purine catabolism regulatory protein-like family protein [Corynebacterium ciconiae DSM 44920]